MNEPSPSTPSSEPAPPLPQLPASESPRAALTRRPKPARKGPGRLPLFRVLLHNDDVNAMDHVVETIRVLTRLSERQAVVIMLTAHTRGVAPVLVTHKERAELYVDQFRSRRLVATIESVDC